MRKREFNIRFEGPAASGKTYCLELVKKRLENEGYEVKHDVLRAEHALKVAWASPK